MPYFFAERIVEEGLYILKNKATIRQTANRFGLSKSSIHKDVSEKLKTINPSLYIQVKGVLNNNFSQRHIRGGIATKNKYTTQNSR